MAVILCGTVVVAVAAARSAPEKERSAVGEARMLFPLPDGHHPEGVAIDRQGTIYLGDRRPEGGLWVSEVLAIAPDGSASRPILRATSTRPS